MGGRENKKNEIAIIIIINLKNLAENENTGTLLLELYK